MEILVSTLWAVKLDESTIQNGGVRWLIWVGTTKVEFMFRISDSRWEAFLLVDLDFCYLDAGHLRPVVINGCLMEVGITPRDMISVIWSPCSVKEPIKFVHTTVFLYTWIFSINIIIFYLFIYTFIHLLGDMLINPYPWDHYYSNTNDKIQCKYFKVKVLY